VEKLCNAAITEICNYKITCLEPNSYLGRLYEQGFWNPAYCHGDHGGSCALPYSLEQGKLIAIHRRRLLDFALHQQEKKGRSARQARKGVMRPAGFTRSLETIASNRSGGEVCECTPLRTVGIQYYEQKGAER
jgi:hypothetical protein